MNSNTPHKPRPAPGELGSTPFRSASANRFRSSLVPMARQSPARSSRPSTKPSSNPTSNRDLFRTSTPTSTRTARFAPNLPADATRGSPGVRRLAPQKTVNSGMSNTASTEPFKMRIPSPDPELSGELLSREVPEDPNRIGSIYADQFLAHKCPPHFDELQRRQFFCILDLRRLKYAANEIFAKKDWKLNINNFAKEYEKSRGLIMLRYGLYEFKNVKPSEEVLKKWRAAHGLPDPEPEDKTTTTISEGPKSRSFGASVTGSTKRKAEEELAPKDNTLMASTANQNKRRNLERESPDPAIKGPAPFKKSKRKADETEDLEENQPSKLHKPAVSTATSKFASILDKAQSGTASPVKRPAMDIGAQPTLSGTPKSIGSPIKANPFAGSLNGLKPTPSPANGASGSVLSSHKIGSVPATSSGNIFSYLSESSANSSGNEIGNAGDDDDESDSGSDHEAEIHGARPSSVPSAVAISGTNNPPSQNGPSLFSSKTSTSTIFGSLSKPNDLPPKGGLFGRIQVGPDGKPLRDTTPNVEETSETPAKVPAVGLPSQTPAKQPGDYTFNAATTPISFGQLGSAAPKGLLPASTTESDKPGTPDQSTTPMPKSSQGFAGFNQATTKQPESQPSGIFGTGSLKPASTPSAGSIFGSLNPSSPAPNLFGAATPKPEDGEKSKDETSSSAPQEQPKPLFPTTGATQNSNATPASSTTSTGLFGNVQKNQDRSTASTNGTPSLFGHSTLFGSQGNKENDGSNKNATPAPEASTKPASAGFTFGNTTGAVAETPKPNNDPVQDSKSVFGSSTGKSPFGFSAPKSSTTAAAPMFENNQAAPEQKQEEPPAGKPVHFGNSTPSGSSIFNFGGQAGSQITSASNNNQAPSTPSFSFGAGSNATPNASFGSSVTQANGNEAKKLDFQFGGSTPGTNSTPFAFGQGSTPSSSFNFSAGGNGQVVNNPFAALSAPSANAPTSGFSAPNAAPSTDMNFTFGQQAPSTPKPTPANPGAPMFGGSTQGTSGGPSFNFTQATPPQNNTPSIFAQKPATGGSGIFGSLLPAADGSKGASSPLPAPSSLGTTPVNGTPEPQTQHEDGEEGSHEQISLTNGGPGEEDEEILHEVRAKVMKYIPVVKGSDEEQENKSPWSTQGVGPLRVLKNKTTGSVRLLLRAEPRGHIALNKTILPRENYKATEKTVKLTTTGANSGELESWVLQVKKPESAQELARVLEAHKSANQ